MARPVTIILIFLLGIAHADGQTSDQADSKLEDAAMQFSQRIEETTRTLSNARSRIADEKATLGQSEREAQNRVLALQAEIDSLTEDRNRLAAQESRFAERYRLLSDNKAFLADSVRGSLEGILADLNPASQQEIHAKFAKLARALQRSNENLDAQSVIESLDLLEARLAEAMGGFSQTGSAVADDDGSVHSGHLLHFGPDTYFVSEDGTVRGLASQNASSSNFLTVHTIKAWDIAAALALVEGQDTASIPLDASGGNALRLQEASGNLWEHLQRGGNVGYVILALGLLALVTAFTKFIELNRYGVDSPDRVNPLLPLIAKRQSRSFSEGLAKLKSTTREFLSVGLSHLDKPKSVLEEHLYANILVHRLRHERRLPQLRVIAAAAPLLGLLGTVVGMVKTFTLITVHGAGDAEKLSSGISQALVTTELGLTVAIPTLVVYGFLAQRAHKSISRLEQYGASFVAMAEDANSNPDISER